MFLPYKRRRRNMKKYLLLSCLAFVLPMTAQSAQTFSKAQAVSTVEQAHRMPDDADVLLEGMIVEQTGRNTYTFKDKTGTIPVEIEMDEWTGFEVTDTTPVRIYGEIDVEDMGSRQIDVQSLAVVP